MMIVDLVCDLYAW